MLRVYYVYYVYITVYMTCILRYINGIYSVYITVYYILRVYYGIYCVYITCGIMIVDNGGLHGETKNKKKIYIYITMADYMVR